MSDSLGPDTLCERCSLLSFDDSAIGSCEVVGGDGVARLSFPESRIEEHNSSIAVFDLRLIPLDWKLEEILPDMPHLALSSQLGCVFCQALLKSLEDTLAEMAKTREIDDGPLDLAAYLSLTDGGIEGLVIKATFNQAATLDGARVFLTLTIFSIEADSGKSDHPTKT